VTGGAEKQIGWATKYRLDYISHETFTVCYRHSDLETIIEVAAVELKDIRVAKQRVTKAKASMSIGKNLAGSFKAQDTYTYV
jgi:hypothetical protein